MPFECKRCKYTCGTRQALEKHLMRKTPCKCTCESPELDVYVLYKELTGTDFSRHKCTWCSYESGSISNLIAHKRLCKFQKDDNEQTKPDCCQTALLQEIQALRKELEDVWKNGTTTNRIQHIEHLQINQFNLQPFGKEELRHIDETFLTKCLLNTTQGVANLLSKIHFDEEVPQNRNVRVKSKKQNLLEKVIDDGTWEQCDKNNTLDELIRKGYKILFAHFLEAKEENEHVKENEHALQSWFIDLSSKKGEYFRLRRDLFVLVLNNTVYFVGKP